MLTIIHGDDITKSRRYFVELKNKHRQFETLESAQVDLTILSQILEGGSFFQEEKNLFIENFLTKKKNSSDYKPVLDYLKSAPDPTRIFLWEGKELGKNILTQFKNAEIKSFKLPSVLFSFLDALEPNKGKIIIKLFHQALINTDDEAIFYMLIRHIRMLLVIREGYSLAIQDHALINKKTNEFPNKPESIDEISEIKRLQGWQKSKLEKQSANFSSKELINLYKDLYIIESGYKTGNLQGSLSSAIDIFLLGL